MTGRCPSIAAICAVSNGVNITLLNEMAVLYEAVAGTITLTTAIVDFNQKFYNEWLDKTINPQKLAAIIRKQGVKPTETSDDKPAVLCAINGAFPLGSTEDENSHYVLQVEFKKPLNQVFVDYDDSHLIDPDDAARYHGYNFKKAIQIIKTNQKSGIPTPISSIITPQQIGKEIVYGVYVNGVKPNEITDIRIVRYGDEFQNGKQI